MKSLMKGLPSSLVEAPLFTFLNQNNAPPHRIGLENDRTTLYMNYIIFSPTSALCSFDTPTATAVSRPTPSRLLRVTVCLRQIPVVACIPGKRDACTTHRQTTATQCMVKKAPEDNARKCRVIQIPITVIEILHQRRGCISKMQGYRKRWVFLRSSLGLPPSTYQLRSNKSYLNQPTRVYASYERVDLGASAR